MPIPGALHDADYLRDDVFRLEAEVVEVKEKPTYPQGELGADAFGRKPVYEDRGLRLRAILALGRADVGDMETSRPTMPGVTVIGGSSDHCILDVTDAPQPGAGGGCPVLPAVLQPRTLCHPAGRCSRGGLSVTSGQARWQ